MSKTIRFTLFITLILGLFLFGTPAYAASVRVTMPSFMITLNETQIDNATRQYPLIVYKDITYFPMTYHDCRFLGLESEYATGTGLDIRKTGFSESYDADRTTGGNPQSATAQIAAFPIRVNGKTIDNSRENFPLLLYRDITYFPLTWRFAVDEFGWDYAFDLSQGLAVNSVSGSEDIPYSIDTVLELVSRAAQFTDKANWIATEKDSWFGSYTYFTQTYYWLERSEWFGSMAMWNGSAVSESSIIEKDPERLDWSFETDFSLHELNFLDLGMWQRWLNGENDRIAPDVTISRDKHENGFTRIRLFDHSNGAVTHLYEYSFSTSNGYLDQYTYTMSGAPRRFREIVKYMYPATVSLPSAARTAAGL